MPPCSDRDTRRSDRFDRRPAGLRAPLLLGTVLMALCGSARAFDDDTFDISPNASYRYDSNLFRLPDGTSAFNDGRQSGTTRTAGIGLQLDKSYGLQHFTVSGNVSRVTYSPFTSLDTTSRVLNAQWAWSITPAITGNIIETLVQTPNNFSDTGLQTTANERKTETREFDLDLRPGASLHPRISVIRSADKSQQTTLNRDNAASTSLQGAIVYDFASGNFADLYFRRGRGTYFNIDAIAVAQLDTQFNERETGFEAHYRSTGVSSFDGKLGYLTREHRNFQSRNFNGPVGQLTYNYAATGKTSLQLQASRSIYSAQSLISSYTVDQSASFGPVWSATSKITVRPVFAISRRNFRGAIVPVPDPLRLTMRTATLSVDWNAYRSVLISASIGKETRAANDPRLRYADRSASLSASLRF